MRIANRFTMFVSLLAVVCLGFAGTARAADGAADEELYWRTSKLNAAGFLDSLTASINGATAVTGTAAAETTKYVDSFHLYPPAGVTGFTTATAFAVAKLLIYTLGTPAGTDTLFYVWQRGPTPSGPWISATKANILIASNAKAADVPLLVDSDAVDNPWLWRYWRFILQPDGSVGGIYPNARLKLARVQ